jgi:putative SOS response-associated peptidase YedK
VQASGHNCTRPDEEDPICNLYAMMKARAEAAALARAMSDRSNNQPPMPGVYPQYAAPIVLRGADGVREMRDASWGMPSSKKAQLDAATERAGGQAQGQGPGRRLH